MSRLFRFSSPFIFTFLIFAVMITAPVILAQATCPQIVEDAISVLGNSCEGVTRNSACYGNIDVQSRFVVGYEEPFEQSGDIARLANLQRLTTVPYNQEKEEWGIALMSVQANIPDTIPGQSVIFMLMGSAQIENAVEQNGSLVADRIPVTTRRSGSLRQAPSAESRILTFIPQDVEVLTYNLSDDGGWLRVSYNGRVGWMMTQMVDSIPEFSQPDTFTPMQAFYLRTGIGRPDCAQAPDTLMVQSPENLVVDLTVNGVEIRVGSTIFLQNPTQSSLQIIVADGQVTVYPDTPQAFIIPEGTYSTTCLETVIESLGLDDIRNDRPVGENCWTSPQPFTDWDKFAALTDLSPDLLVYDFDLPIQPIETPIPPLPPVVVIDDNCVVNPDWIDIYIVQPNDTLSSIAPNYNLTAEELGFGNCLNNLDLIVPNQELQVPPIIIVNNPPPVIVPPVAPPPVVPPPPPTFVDLEVDIVASMANPEENQAYSYNVTVTNAGTQDATGVIVNVPCANVHVRYDSDSGGGAYNSVTGDWTIGTVSAGSTVSLQINVTARPGEAIAGAFDTTATITALTETDSNLANNSATASVDIGYYTVAIFVDETTQVVADDGVCSLTEAINNANSNNFWSGRVRYAPLS
ncbi:MAG: LysM peptidoglycan-binding domain-containing protein, partial [Anaerolineae bacterium]|nr:LysM peptidoglycan-binding domain-containing protein [Anaerolineae bacterium]